MSVGLNLGLQNVYSFLKIWGLEPVFLFLKPIDQRIILDVFVFPLAKVIPAWLVRRRNDFCFFLKWCDEARATYTEDAYGRPGHENDDDDDSVLEIMRRKIKTPDVSEWKIYCTLFS